MPISTTRNESSLFDGLTGAEIELLQMRAARFARIPDTKAEDFAEAIVFTRGSTRYAAPLACLREVLPLRGFCRVPGASRCVPGMFHFHGEILSIHDIEAFMDPDAGGRPAPWVIVIENGADRLALMADEIIDIVQVAAAHVTPMPMTFGERAVCFQGVLGGNILLLAPTALFSTARFFLAF